MTATGEPGAREDPYPPVGGVPATITTPTTIIAPTPIQVPSDVPMPNSNGSGNGNHKSTIVIESQPKRRVSIISDPPAIGGTVGLGAGYDNPAYEQNPRRKISQVSGEFIRRRRLRSIRLMGAS